MLGFLVILLLGYQADAAFSLSIHGARAKWENASVLSYRPQRWIPPQSVKVEALHLETGNRLSFQLETQKGEEWLLRPDWNGSLESWAREPFVLVVSDRYGNELDRTYFQIGPLLDDLYRYEGCLGVCWEGERPVLKVWAPTAKNVSLVWADGKQSLPMYRHSDGVWSVAGDPSWKGKSYLYRVEVFTAASGRVETHLVTDPYSLALGENSSRSIIVHPDDPELTPEGWESKERPALAHRVDSVLYELHVREFSQSDKSVPEDLRGTFKAFTLEGTAGDRHLRDLAEAGITHIHLLPVNDFSTVEENRSARRDPRIPSGLPGDSPVPQQEVMRYRTLDSFNWGYDPFHYFAPEGSYSLDPDGPARIKEFRELVMALHKRGLRVVVDVVFNHTFANGLSPESVLDKIVPGYYYRLDREGNTHNSSCCADTASERWMMEKLMRDAVESWRSVFKVDGFRFDLMNLHSVQTMTRLRDDLWSKDPSLLLYGEAWGFGSLLEQAPGEAYTQDKVYGNFIGAFNDRIRDAIRGGTTNSKEKSDQGFVTGLFYDFNHEPANRNTPVDLGAQREKLLYLGDVIRIGLAGNLRDYRIRSYKGSWTTGGNLLFHGSLTGFSAHPEETINYVSAHDGYTLFDAFQAKLPFYSRWRDPGTAPAQERLERQILAVGLIALSQGIPFFDSGIEILRSKSGDQNSYDSGDWFNQLDWTYETNGWGRGLPPAHSNPGDWPFWRPRLAEEGLKVGRKEIEGMKEAFLELIRLRKSSPLFRLRTAKQVQERVRFLETDLGPMQPPGLIAMEISDESQEDLDPKWKRLFVVVNVTNSPQGFFHESLRGKELHRIFGFGEVRASELKLPARSLTVWGEPQ